MKLTVKCEICNAVLEEDDCYDISITDTHVYLYKVGHCPACDMAHQWVEVCEKTHVRECWAEEYPL